MLLRLVRKELYAEAPEGHRRRSSTRNLAWRMATLTDSW